ncbi:hypothetical protein V1512DRAFT_256470 [Lipomyces arxii]|uniref:uncharacterized protein n=1 Tax=Lipomyces arxii TaxID=56418 RepID=UPI0034CFA837
MPFELHVWGRIGDLQTFDTNCLIAEVYLKLTRPQLKDTYVIVPSSNPTLSSTFELPCIREGEEIVASGLFNVIRFLKVRGFDLDAELSAANKAKNTALMTFIDCNFTVLSLYIQRLHIVHFQENFRPGVTKLVTFPLQYIIPMLLFNSAKRRIAHIHDIDVTNKATDASSKAIVPGFSFIEKRKILYGDVSDSVPKTLVDKINEAAGGRAEFQALCKMLNLATESLPSIEDILAEGKSAFLFGDRPSTADAFLLGHLAVETQPKYFTPFLKDLISSNYPALQSYMDKNIGIVKSSGEHTVGLVGPTDQLTFWSTSKWYLSS